MFKRLLGFIVNPDATTKAELKRPENQSSFKSGLIWLAVAQVVLAMVLMGLGLVAGLIGRQVTSTPMWLYAMSFFGPFQALLWGLQAWVLTSLGFFSFAYVLDFFMARLFGAPQGRQVLVFNMLVKSMLPWQIFMIIPILGWLVLIVAGFMAAMRVLALVYEEKDLVRRFAALVVASVVCGLLQFLVMLALVPIIALAYSFQMTHFSRNASSGNSQEQALEAELTKELAQLDASRAERYAQVQATPTVPVVEQQFIARPPKHRSKANFNKSQNSPSTQTESAATESSLQVPLSMASPTAVETQVVAEITPTPATDWKKNAVITGAKIVEISGGAERLLRLFQ